MAAIPVDLRTLAPAGVYRSVTKGSALPLGTCKALWVGTAMGAKMGLSL